MDPLLIYLSSHENHFYASPDALGPLTKFIWLTLIMLPKPFNALARSDVIILTSLSLSYHSITIIISLNFEL